MHEAVGQEDFERVEMEEEEVEVVVEVEVEVEVESEEGGGGVGGMDGRSDANHPVMTRPSEHREFQRNLTSYLLTVSCIGDFVT